MHVQMNCRKFQRELTASMISVVASNPVDHGFEPRSDRTKHYEIGIRM